jgi:hypothetical protein
MDRIYDALIAEVTEVSRKIEAALSAHAVTAVAGIAVPPY